MRRASIRPRSRGYSLHLETGCVGFQREAAHKINPVNLDLASRFQSLRFQGRLIEIRCAVF